MLKALDRLEDHPKLYLRTNIDCSLITDESDCLLNNAVITKSQVYILSDFNPGLLDLPHLDNYTDSREKPLLGADRRTTPLLDQVKLFQN